MGNITTLFPTLVDPITIYFFMAIFCSFMLVVLLSFRKRIKKILINQGWLNAHFFAMGVVLIPFILNCALVYTLKVYSIPLIAVLIVLLCAYQLKYSKKDSKIIYIMFIVLLVLSLVVLVHYFLNFSDYVQLFQEFSGSGKFGV